MLPLLQKIKFSLDTKFLGNYQHVLTNDFNMRRWIFRFKNLTCYPKLVHITQKTTWYLFKIFTSICYPNNNIAQSTVVVFPRRCRFFDFPTTRPKPTNRTDTERLWRRWKILSLSLFSLPPSRNSAQRKNFFILKREEIYRHITVYKRSTLSNKAYTKLYSDSIRNLHNYNCLSGQNKQIWD